MIEEIVELWLDISPYLLLGMFIAGLLHIYLGSPFIKKHLGGGKKSIFKASLLGVPLPVCSCGVIPIATSLHEEGASKSATLSFLVSTPTTGVDSILATYSLLGPLFAIFRPFFAFFAGIFTGFVNYMIEGDGKEIKEHKHEEERKSFLDGLKYAFLELPEDMGKWLVIGVIAGGIIASIPFQIKASYPYDMFAALAISLPLYVCATGSIPIATALITKGFSPGSALVFLIAGPATNTITLSFVRYKLGRRSFFIYLFSIITLSLFAGITFNFIWDYWQNIATLTFMPPYWIKLLSGIILAALIGRALIAPFLEKKMEMTEILFVPDMHCRNCKATIEKELRKKGIKNFYVSLEKKSVGLLNPEDREKAIDAIKRAGYKIEKP
ncbi:MAG: hypothetical protein DRN29_02870 [Thermoplasmata archaeon]|nr:MAG: hypothetical protein DRN29_02870 [Thermoplasmata archaeon]